MQAHINLIWKIIWTKNSRLYLKLEESVALILIINQLIKQRYYLLNLLFKIAKSLYCLHWKKYFERIIDLLTHHLQNIPTSRMIQMRSTLAKLTRKSLLCRIRKPADFKLNNTTFELHNTWSRKMQKYSKINKLTKRYKAEKISRTVGSGRTF